MYLVFDVGGTNLRGGLYDPSSGCLTNSVRRTTPNFLESPHCNPEEIFKNLLSEMRSLGRELAGKTRLRAVVAALPGPISPDGHILALPTVLGPKKQFQPLPALETLKTIWPECPVFLINDITAAGYRYVGKGYKDFCVIAAGSGVGAKVFLDAEPITGKHGRGGELGHLLVDENANAPICDCGICGHLSALASGRGFLRLAQSRARTDPESFSRSILVAHYHHTSDSLDNSSLVAAFKEEDAWTRKILIDASKPFVRVIATVHLALGIEKFFVIGGSARALGTSYRKILVNLCTAACWDTGQDWDEMLELGFPDDNDGQVGAGIFAEVKEQRS